MLTIFKRIIVIGLWTSYTLISTENLSNYHLETVFDCPFLQTTNITTRNEGCKDGGSHGPQHPLRASEDKDD